MSKPQHTRQTLIAKIKDQHDEASWEEFTRLYERYIYVAIMNMGVPTKDIEDISQRILVILWERLPDFQYEPQKCKFRTWMNKVIFNCVSTYKRTDFYHQKKLHLFTTENTAQVSLDQEFNDTMEKQWKQHMTKLALDNIKHELSETSIKCFEMFYKGLPIDQICEELDLKKNSAYVIRKRVIDRLRIELIRLDNELS